MDPNFFHDNSENIFLKKQLFSNFLDLDEIHSYSAFSDNSESMLINKQEEDDFEQIFPLIFIDKARTKEESIKNGNQLDFFKLYNIKEENKAHCFNKDNKELIQQQIREKIFSKRPFKEKKFLGRKTKIEEGLGEHNKFSDDNLLRKCKNLVLDSISKFINKKIAKLYENENKKVLKNKQLFKLALKEKERSLVSYNKLLLDQKLESIFSEDISTKYKKYNLSHNKDLIKDLLNEKDDTKRLIFQKLFNLSFTDCLNHFRGTCLKEELSGMNKFDKYCSEAKFGKNSEEYKKILKIFIQNYENIIMDKKERNKRK